MSDYVFVWEDRPGNTHGFVPVVRAANGERVVNNAGTNYAANHAAWVKAAGHPLPAWTYLYPGDDGAQAGAVLAHAAPHAPFYVLDIEDPGIGAGTVEAFCGALPHAAPLYLSTYGLISQCQSRDIPYGARGIDGIWPQSYFENQCPGIVAWRSAHFTTWPTFSPSDFAGWAKYVDHSPFAIWRYGITDLAAASNAAATARAALPVSPPKGSPVSDSVTQAVSAVDAAGKAGHLDDAIKRGLTIWRDLYGGESIVKHLASIDSTLTIIAGHLANTTTSGAN